jgi:hypothetical protein
MTGFKSKRAMSDSRFAVTYEDPDYELEEELEYDAEQGERVFARMVKDIEEFSPHSTSNS